MFSFVIIAAAFCELLASCASQAGRIASDADAVVELAGSESLSDNLDVLETPSDKGEADLRDLEPFKPQDAPQILDEMDETIGAGATEPMLEAVEAYAAAHDDDGSPASEENWIASSDNAIADELEGEYGEADLVASAPEFIRSVTYALMRPVISSAFVFSLDPPVIETAYVYQDDSARLSKSLLLLSIDNSTQDEIRFIAGKYSISDASASGILREMGITSSMAGRLRSEKTPTSTEPLPESARQEGIDEDLVSHDGDILLPSSFDGVGEDVAMEDESASRADGANSGDGLAKEAWTGEASDGSGRQDEVSGEAKSDAAMPTQDAVQGYDFSIERANQIELYKLNGKDMIRINGNVRLSFSLSGQKRTLAADSVLYDVEENEIVASGGVSISSQSSSSQNFQDISAQELSINLNDNKVRLADAVGKTKKSNQSISSAYYMSGSGLILDAQTGEMYFDSGSLLPSPSLKTANWSLGARKMIMKNNGDVLLSGLMLKVGRVPFPFPFPLPFVFMLPGTPLTFNPAIGFTSDKGAFVNLTYEVYGKYPSIGNSGEEGNSLTNLLKGNAGGNVSKDGILYSYSNSAASSGGNDYMAAFLDFYSGQGVFFGIDAKNAFFGKLNTSLKAGVAYKPQQQQRQQAQYFSSKDYSSFRYFFDLDNLSLSNVAGLSISAKVPIYSDPDVGHDYLNRLTAFSIDSLFLSSPEFPSSVSGNATTRNYSLSASYSKSFAISQISSVSASLNASYSRYWAAPENAGERYSYASGEFTLPSLTLRVSGTLFSFTRNDTSSESVKKSISEGAEDLDESQKREQELLIMRDRLKALNVQKVSSVSTKVSAWEEYEQGQEPDGKYVIDDAEDFLDRLGFIHSLEGLEIHDSELRRKTDETQNSAKAAYEGVATGMAQGRDFSFSDRYGATASLSDSAESRRSFFTGSHISLKYSFSDTFSNIFQRPATRSDFLGLRKTSNAASGSITLNGGLGNGVFSFTQTLTPNYQYSFLEGISDVTTHEFSLKSNFTSSLSIPLSLPTISVNYSMGAVLYSYKSTYDDASGEKTVTEKSASWDSQSISSHRIGLSTSFNSIVTASVDTSLPPMESYTLTPNISLSISGLSVRLSHSLNGTDYSSLKSMKTSGSVSYSKSPFSISFSAEYDYSKKLESGASSLRPFMFNHSASVSLLSSWISLSESVQFYGLTSSGAENHFPFIRLHAGLNSFLSADFTLSGPYDGIDLTKTQFSVKIPEFTVSFWKNRISLSLAFNASANVDFKDAFQNSITYNFSFALDIKEFLKASITLSGTNNNFLKYTGNERYGPFSLGSFLADILRGINIFSPEMSSSNFKMSGLTASIEHDMGDFSFSFSFTGKFELNVNEYEWKPEYKILLKWGVIPELKIDKSVRP